MHRIIAATIGAIVAVCGMTAITGPAPASAATGWTTTCTSPSYGYSCVSYSGYSGQSTWGYPVNSPSGAHNCTNYAAYRLAQNGAANPGNLGNATDWDNNAAARGFAVDGNAVVGSIAQWEGYTGPAAAVAEGHVAYVESVTDTYIDVSQDAWGGTTSTARITRGGSYWPSHFIHIKDQADGAPAEGALVSYQGNVYRIAGGAPIYVSNWAAVGGSRPTTALTDSQFAALRTYPADGTFVTVNAGYVYRFAGGAPMYVSSWNAVGGPHSTILVDQAAIDNAGNAAPWDHVRSYPADGTFVTVNAGYVYRFAGGAPIYVSTWSAVGGSQPATLVDQADFDNADAAAPWNHVHRYPADGTLVAAAGYVYRFAGGAPLYVSTWSTIGGAKATTQVDHAALDHADGAAPWNHVHRFPINGTVLNGISDSRSWRVDSGVASPIARTSGVIVDLADIDNAGLGVPWNHLASGRPIVVLARLPVSTTAPSVRVVWSKVVTSSATIAYDVRWKLAGGIWHMPASWQGVASGPIAKAMTAGHRYCFAVRGHNRAHITGPWSSTACVRRLP